MRVEGMVDKMEMVGFRECHVLHGSQGYRGIGKEINGFLLFSSLVSQSSFY